MLHFLQGTAGCLFCGQLSDQRVFEVVKTVPLCPAAARRNFDMGVVTLGDEIYC